MREELFPKRRLLFQPKSNADPKVTSLQNERAYILPKRPLFEVTLMVMRP